MSKKQIYFVGIGGIGMSALARYYLAQNWTVSGSDDVASLITRELQKEGLKVKIRPKKPGFGPKTALIIHSRAVPVFNVEIQAAGRWQIPVLSYPEAVGALTEKYQTIAIAGAHGKSTTTAMIVEIFLRAGFDPTVIIGTKLKSLSAKTDGGKNFRMGKSPWLILEADEFGGAFWHYSPVVALITNIDKEHLDFYKNLAGVKKSFLKFVGNVKENGLLILNRDDKNIFSLKNKIEKITEKKKIKISWYSFGTDPLLAEKLKKELIVPGRHNVSNALGAFALARELKIGEKTAIDALKNYAGAWRRFEYKGNLKPGIRVYDDYAHHPVEIKASLAGAKEKFPDSKIICVFQPHQVQRLKLLFRDFSEAFGDSDATIILPPYQVAGRDRSDSGQYSRALAETIKKKNNGKEIFYLRSPADLKKFLKNNSSLFESDDCVLIMMGAGDIAELTPEILR